MDIVLFIKALQHKCWRSVGHQVLQPAKDVNYWSILCWKKSNGKSAFISIQQCWKVQHVVGTCIFTWVTFKITNISYGIYLANSIFSHQTIDESLYTRSTSLAMEQTDNVNQNYSRISVSYLGILVHITVRHVHILELHPNNYNGSKWQRNTSKVVNCYHLMLCSERRTLNILSAFMVPPIVPWSLYYLVLACSSKINKPT